MEQMVLEIRAAEGGADAKMLVDEQLDVYVTLGNAQGL